MARLKTVGQILKNNGQMMPVLEYISPQKLTNCAILKEGCESVGRNGCAK